jgi:hypothetical protein
MENFICVQCGTQFVESVQPPPSCPICEDERQFVHYGGQEWTTLERLAADHHNRFEGEAPQLLGIGTEPEFAIGQRALLLQSSAGNLLWDCISLLDQKTIDEVKTRGGIRAIAISHPHFYSSMVEWAEHFDAQVLLHAKDRQWVMRESPRIHFWEGTTRSLWDGLTLVNCGGHFEGGAVLHWPAASGGCRSKGALLTGDIITVVQDRRYVSFMRSYPNLIPLGAVAIHRILETIEPFSFEQIYGGWWKANVLSDANAAVARSADRYLRAIGQM